MFFDTSSCIYDGFSERSLKISLFPRHVMNATNQLKLLQLTITNIADMSTKWFRTNFVFRA